MRDTSGSTTDECFCSGAYGQSCSACAGDDYQAAFDEGMAAGIEKGEKATTERIAGWIERTAGERRITADDGPLLWGPEAHTALLYIAKVIRRGGAT